MTTVAILHGSSPFESHSIQGCRAEMRQRMQVSHLSRLQSFYRIGIKQHMYLRIGMPSLYAGTGYIMGRFGQSLPQKVFTACLDNAGIIHIHVLHKDPGTDAIGSQRTAFSYQIGFIRFQQGFHLPFRFAARHTRTGCPVMLVSGIRFGGQIDPQSNLTSIQRGLLHDRDSARRLFLQDSLQSLPLIGGITQEVTAKHGYHSPDFHLPAQYPMVCFTNGRQLLFIIPRFRIDMKHQMRLSRSSLTPKKGIFNSSP